MTQTKQEKNLTPGQRLKTLRESAGLNLTQFSQLLGLSEELIAQLEQDDFSRLSSLPYLKGVLKKYALLCQADYQELLGLVTSQVKFKEAGEEDFLPPNRFKQTQLFLQLNWHPLWIVAFLFLGYLVYQLAFLVLPPRILLSSLPSISLSSSYSVSGRVWGKIKEFSINHESVSLKNHGQFQKTLYLNPGVNLIEFRAVDYLGRETRLEKTVIFQPEI